MARARFELNRNDRYYQGRVPYPKIRALTIDGQKMKELSEWAFKKMTGFMENSCLLDQERAKDAFGGDID